MSIGHLYISLVLYYFWSLLSIKMKFDYLLILNCSSSLFWNISVWYTCCKYFLLVCVLLILPCSKTSCHAPMSVNIFCYSLACIKLFFSLAPQSAMLIFHFTASLQLCFCWKTWLLTPATDSFSSLSGCHICCPQHSSLHSIIHLVSIRVLYLYVLSYHLDVISLRTGYVFDFFSAASTSVLCKYT